MMSGHVCECGCGQATGVSKQTYTRYGLVKGQPLRFLPHHHLRGSAHPKWNNGYITAKAGYLLVYIPDHHRSDKNGYVMEHVVIAENAVRRPLKRPIVVHHVNGERSDNRPENLVICENQQYHFLLHIRERALKACGNPDWIICNYCQTYDNPSSMYVSRQGNSHYHLACLSRHRKETACH